MLNSIIDRKSLALNLYEPNWQTTDFFEIIKKDLIFGILPEPVLKMLVCKQGEMLNFDANELIIDNG